MFREAIIAVTKAADWYALHPLTVEELREKNIGSSGQHPLFDGGEKHDPDGQL